MCLLFPLPFALKNDLTGLRIRLKNFVEYIALGLRELWDSVTVNVESKLIPHLWSPSIGGVTLMASNTVDGDRQIKC